MSFNKHKTIIEEGDTVVIYLTINNIHAIEVYEKIKNKKGELVEYIFQVHNSIRWVQHA
jgi:tRNA (adenine57-N1/adenine58-N1)-methyltransferase catalytic subunit